MLRSDAIKVILERVEEELVVSNLGDPSKETYYARDRPKNFYMLGSLGLASSISLGLALSQKEKVLCIDGDGSLLSNLGSLATIANQKPGNLVIIAYWTMGHTVRQEIKNRILQDQQTSKTLLELVDLG